MFHELFDIWKELREISRERERLRERQVYLQRKWVLMAKFISGKAVVPKPWERSYARPENVINLNGTIQHDTDKDYGTAIRESGPMV